MRLRQNATVALNALRNAPWSDAPTPFTKGVYFFQMKKCSPSTINPAQSPPCSDATRDLLRRKVLEKLGSPKEKAERALTQVALDHPERSPPQVEGIRRKPSEMTERRLLKSSRSIPSGLDLNSEEERPPPFSRAQGKGQVSRQMSTPDTPPLVIVSSPAGSSLPLVASPPPAPSLHKQSSPPLVQSPQLPPAQPTHVPKAVPTQQPKIFCVTTTAASLGIDTPPPSADDYLVKPSSAGAYPSTSAAQLAGNSPANVASARESLNSSHSSMSPPAYSTPPSATTEMVQSQQENVAGEEDEPSQKKSLVMLPVLKDIIEKTYPKLPASLVGAEDNQEKFLIIECERLVTLPNLLGPVRPARLVLCSMGQFSFQCLQKELYSGSLSDNLLFSVALKSLTSQSGFRLCGAYGMLESNPVGVVLHTTPPALHGSVPSTPASTSSHATTSKWGDSINQLIDSHRCLMWFSPSDAERSTEAKEGEDPDERWSNCILKGIDKMSVCKNCRSRLLAVQKPYKQPSAAQVEEKPKKSLERKDPPSVADPPSEEPISSQQRIQFFGSHRSRPAGTSPLMVSTVRIRGRGSPRSAPVNAAAQAENQAVKRHLAEKIMARLHKAHQSGVDPHSPTTPPQFVSPTAYRGGTSPLATHVLPSIGASDITSSSARGKSRKDGVGMRKRTHEYTRGDPPNAAAMQQDGSPHKISKSDNPLTPSKTGSVPVHQEIA